MADRETRLVWDLPLRVTHWLLVASIAGSWATHYAGVQWFAWHRRFGYTVFVLVAFRVIWGFVGTRHARFRQFLRGPRAALAHLRRSAGGESTGHNALGGWSVVAMLALLLGQATSGMFANDGILNAGPLYGWVTATLSNRVTALHRLGSGALLVLIVLHLAAVAWYVLFRRQALVRAMFTGRKSVSVVAARDAIEESRTGRAILIVLGIAVALAVAVRVAPQATIALY